MGPSLTLGYDPNTTPKSAVGGTRWFGAPLSVVFCPCQPWSTLGGYVGVVPGPPEVPPSPFKGPLLQGPVTRPRPPCADIGLRPELGNSVIVPMRAAVTTSMQLNRRRRLAPPYYTRLQVDAAAAASLGTQAESAA